MDRIHALKQQVVALDIPAPTPQKSLFRSIFAPEKRKLAALRRGHTEISHLVDRLASQLDMASLALQKEMVMLDTLYEKSQACYHALQLKILAGEHALTSIKQVPSTKDQAAKALGNLFSGRLHQLRQSKTICLQMSLQIRLTQYNQQVVVDKLKQTTELALPLWQNQLALALSISRQQQALDTYREAARMSAKAMQQTEQTLRYGTGDVKQQSQTTRTELERLREADRQLKRLMDETLASAKRAGTSN